MSTFLAVATDQVSTATGPSPWEAFSTLAHALDDDESFASMWQLPVADFRLIDGGVVLADGTPAAKLNWNPGLNDRPPDPLPAAIHLCTADQYLQWCRVALERRAPIPRWTSFEQFAAVCRELPDHVGYVPSEVDLLLVKPFDADDLAERIVEFIEDHPDVAAAIKSILNERTAQ